MKKKAITCGLLFLVFFVPLEIYYFYQKHLFNKKIKIEILSKNPQKKIYCFGDSHIHFGLDTNIATNIKNYAFASEPFLFTLKKIQLLNPRIAVIALGFQNLQKYYENSLKEGFMNNYQYQFLFQQLTSEERKNLFKVMDFESIAFLYTQQYIPFLGNRLKLQKDELWLGGFKNLGGNSHLSPNDIKIRYDVMFKQQNNQQSELQLIYLQEILTYAKEKNIKIVFLATPVSQAYLKLVPKDVFVQVAQQLHELKKRYTFDYWDYTYLNLPDTCFFDADHLNGTGSKQFATLLKKRLQLLEQ